MNKIGIICGYNPFHNGHIYHLNKIKEMYPDSLIVLVMSGNFTQRGIPSIIDKWDKTDIALNYGIDLVIELPFPFATDGADIFAHGAISILKELKVDKLIFGSEENNIDYLKELAKVSLTDEYNQEVKKYLNTEVNYPTALNLAFKKFNLDGTNTANDLLALSYIKEIYKQDTNIEPISIKRTNDFHSLDLDDISSATSIRHAIINNKDITKSVPTITLDKINNNFILDNYFPYLKYKILSEDNLDIYHTVPDGFTNKIKKEIRVSNSYEELINNLKSKHFTQSRITRMLLHIMCSYTKELAKSFKEVTYIRILGMNNKGKEYLNSIKKDISIPIITTFSKGNDKMLEFEQHTTDIYALTLPKEEINIYLEKEYKEKLNMK